jgi:hypothetical protein
MPLEAARASAETYCRRSFPFNTKRRLAECRLEATDVDWSSGEGEPVRGPIAALLLLITGRPAALTSLDGDGVPLLRRRLEVAS